MLRRYGMPPPAYLVKEPFALGVLLRRMGRNALGAALAVASMIAVLYGVRGDPTALVLFGGVAVFGCALFVVMLARHARPGTLVAVGPTGVVVGGVKVPWTSIRQVVVMRPGVSPDVSGAAGPSVGLRLRPGAPLPGGLDSLITNPTDPRETPPDALRVVVPVSLFDVRGLVWAVRTHGQREVQVVAMEGDAEQLLG